MHAILGYLIADLGVRLLPASAADRAALWLARLTFGLKPRARRALEDNLRRVAPGLAARERQQVAREAFEHFALSLVEFLRLRRLRPADLGARVEVRGQQHLAAARAAGRGVIVLSAHLGNWEWGAAYLAAGGVRLHVVARPHPNGWVERFFRLRRLSGGVATLHPEPPIWVRAAAALKRGDWIALMGDRPTPGARGPVCAWAAALARRTGAVVLPAVMIRTAPGRHVACFGAPLSPAACANGGYRATMLHYLERYPSQWLAFEPLPPGWA